MPGNSPTADFEQEKNEYEKFAENFGEFFCLCGAEFVKVRFIVHDAYYNKNVNKITCKGDILMSVYYEIFEHLVIEDTEQHSYEQSLTISRLALLGAWLLNNRGGVGKLRIIADGEEYTFSGNMMTQAYHEALNAADKAKNLEMVWNYWYTWSAQAEDPGPFAMMQYLDDVLKENPSALDGLFYSAYNNADCGEGAGISVAYGKKNGVMHTGLLPYKTVESIPDGEWYTPQTAVVCDLDGTEGKDIIQIETICRQLMQFSEADSLDVSDDSFSFALNNLRIKDDTQLKLFMQLYAQLIELTNGECSLIGELADVSVPDVRMIRFDVEYNGDYTLEMASI